MNEAQRNECSVHPVVLRLRDDYGEWVTAGDTVYFYYGIPPVAVDAAIIERNGKLIGLCPGHKPSEFNLRSLRRYVGSWYKHNDKIEARFSRAGKEAVTTETTQVGAGESSPSPDGSHPPLEHVAWVLKHVADHLKEGGTFRYLIYDRMGYGPEAYLPMYEAGGMAISNAFCELRELRSANDKINRRGFSRCLQCQVGLPAGRAKEKVTND